MLKTIWLKTIRDNRWAILGWGIGVGLILTINVIAYVIQYPTEADRLKGAAALRPLLESFRFFLGDPVDISTAGGFVTWRALGFIPVLLSIWAALSATGSTRGEEEHGISELVLTTPHSRSNVILQKWLGYSLSLLGIVLLIWLVLYLGSLPFDAGIEPLSSLLAMLNGGLLAWFWGSLAMLIGQFFRARGAAAGLTIGLMLLTYFINTIAPQLPATRWLGYLSPFYYFNINKPLVPGSSFDLLALLVAPILAILCVVAAVLLFERRDSGAVVQVGQPRTTVAVSRPLKWRDRLLGNPFGKAIRDLRLSTLWWSLAIGLYSGYLVAIITQVLPLIKQALGGSDSVMARIAGQMTTAQDLVALSLFSFLPLLLGGYAVTQVAGWTGEEENGRLEIALTTPQPRTTMILSRFAAVMLMGIVIVVAVGTAMFVGAAIGGVAIDAGKLLAGLVMIIPFLLTVAGAGFALAAWLKRPGGAVVIVGVLLVTSYFFDLLAQSLEWPSLVQALSIFHEYGTPARTGFDLGNFLILTVAGLVLLAVAVVGFQRRDVVKQ